MLLDMLTELSRREKAANIKPDADIDAFMKASINEPCLSLVYFLSLFFIDRELIKDARLRMIFLFDLIRHLQWAGKKPMWSPIIF